MIVNKMEEKKIKKPTGIKMVIILSALLAVSIVGLAGTLIYQSMKDSEPVAVTVPDNIISPDAEGGPSEKESTDKKEESVPERSTNQSSGNAQSELPTYETDLSVCASPPLHWSIAGQVIYQ